MIACALAGSARHGFAADHYGRVTFGSVPVPGATVTATQVTRDPQSAIRDPPSAKQTVTDASGTYHLADLTPGVWTVRVEMLGFVTVEQDITVAADARALTGDADASTARADVLTWELRLLPIDEIAGPGTSTPRDDSAATGVAGSSPAGASPSAPSPSGARAADPASSAPTPSPASPTAPAAFGPTGFQRAQVNPAFGASAVTNDPALSDADRSPGSTDDGSLGFLINGSVNNGAASPFAQLAAFGNNRRGARSLYNGGFGVLLDNSAFDARPFSFAGQETPKPTYNDMQILASFAGPLKIPGLVRNGPNLFLGYQRTIDHKTSTASALMPTALERAGDFSQSRDALGRPVQIVDPTTGVPFPGNSIPSGRISPQAASLLGYYPAPNIDGSGRFNYETPVVAETHQDALQSRFSQMFSGGRNQLFGNIAYQRTTIDTTNLFGFLDSNHASGVDTTINWSHRFSQFWSLRLREQFTYLTTSVTPYFANRTNVSGEAGITGNNQEPPNWGPPNLMFSSGIAGLASPQALANRNLTNSWGVESLWTHGRHNVTFGGDVRRQQWDVLTQQDARGTFTFTGSLSGSDLADFLLGIPHSSSIAFGNADKYLRAPAYDAYITDDWRMSPTLTVNAGIRWEFEAPVTELFGRLVNLDIAPDFTAVSPVLSTDPVGALTGQHYPASLVRPDWRGFQPRVGMALRPVPGSSLVIRAGYGMYRNTSVYEPIALLMAQQPPLSNTLSVQNSAANPLTLADGFIAAPGSLTNTFAVDPDFRVGYAHNWQVLVQRDLRASLTVTATYLGTKGSHLMQEFLPNTVPIGTANPCMSCPAGFVYLTSNGESHRQTGTLQLRRRMRNGLTATVQYAFSKATDNAGAFTGVNMSGSAIAQDWRHLDAEWGPSNFDERHLVTAQVQFTTGVGAAGGAFVDGARGSLLKGWTFTAQLSAGSGFPLTPVYLTSVAGTGITGTIRPDVNPTAAGEVPSGYFLNPLAYRAPASGQWGNAGRNSITGPGQFMLDAGIGRMFQWGDRLTLDWRLNATNVLNRVTYAAINTTFGSPQFGLPTLANPMRKVQISLRLRF